MYYNAVGDYKHVERERERDEPCETMMERERTHKTARNKELCEQQVSIKTNELYSGLYFHSVPLYFKWESQIKMNNTEEGHQCG